MAAIAASAYRPVLQLVSKCLRMCSRWLYLGAMDGCCKQLRYILTHTWDEGRSCSETWLTYRTCLTWRPKNGPSSRMSWWDRSRRRTKNTRSWGEILPTVSLPMSCLSYQSSPTSFYHSIFPTFWHTHLESWNKTYYFISHQLRKVNMCCLSLTS